MAKESVTEMLQSVPLLLPVVNTTSSLKSNLYPRNSWLLKSLLLSHHPHQCLPLLTVPRP